MSRWTMLDGLCESIRGTYMVFLTEKERDTILAVLSGEQDALLLSNMDLKSLEHKIRQAHKQGG